jgi:hypothetical protein
MPRNTEDHKIVLDSPSNNELHDFLSAKRRKLLLASTTLGAVGLFRPLCAFAQGTLPTITVYGQPLNGDVHWGTSSSNSPSMMLGNPAPGYRAAAASAITNGSNVLKAADTGDPIATLDEFFKGLSAQPRWYVQRQIEMVGAFTQWLRNGGYKRFYGQNEFGLQPTGQHPGYRYGMGSMFGVYYDELSRLPPISDFGFYGNPLMPIAAIYYWVAGGGVPRSIDIRSLNLRMGLGDFKPIKDVLSNSNYSVGTYQVSSFFSTNLFTHAPTDLWAAGTLGRIGGDINGVLTINADNTYVFNGSYTLHPDKFDA